jgi:ABC-type multidrug transport system fused ATPase/permease subunit
MLGWLHELHPLLGAVLVCAAFVVPTLLGSYLLQPFIARLFQGERDINTILGFLLNAFALYFGVLLALLSIAVFENHNKAQDAVDREAAGLIKLYRDVRQYPDPAGRELSAILHRYTDEVIKNGWALQAKGEISREEIAIMTELHGKLAQHQPGGVSESLLHAQTLRALDEFVEARRLRITAGGSAIPHIMWAIVLCGAVLNAFVIWMFDLRRSTHAIIGGTLSLFIGLVIYMIASLDVPFRGPYGIKPEALIEVHKAGGMVE